LLFSPLLSRTIHEHQETKHKEDKPQRHRGRREEAEKNMKHKGTKRRKRINPCFPFSSCLCGETTKKEARRGVYGLLTIRRYPRFSPANGSRKKQ
jgi:hypothetical protein